LHSVYDSEVSFNQVWFYGHSRFVSLSVPISNNIVANYNCIYYNYIRRGIIESSIEFLLSDIVLLI